MWTQNGKKLLDGFAGLAAVNVSRGRREIAEAIADAARPVACAAGLANLRIMEQDRLVENAETTGARLVQGLGEALERETPP